MGFDTEEFCEPLRAVVVFDFEAVVLRGDDDFAEPDFDDEDVSVDFEALLHESVFAELHIFGVAEAVFLLLVNFFSITKRCLVEC